MEVDIDQKHKSKDLDTTRVAPKAAKQREAKSSNGSGIRYYRKGAAKHREARR